MLGKIRRKKWAQDQRKSLASCKRSRRGPERAMHAAEKHSAVAVGKMKTQWAGNNVLDKEPGGNMARVVAMAVILLCCSGWPAPLAAGQQQQVMGVDVNEEQLHAGDYEALRAIRGSLADLPGSFFFDTWELIDGQAGSEFYRPVYPCTSFAGLICDYDSDGLLRIRQLNLGTDLADSPGLTGILPPALGSLTALQQLTLSPGLVRGPLPPTLAALQQLQFLGISKNQISGSIPASLASLRSLQTLDLSYNNLHGPIPSSLLQLPNLQALLLSHNQLTGPIPTTISSPLLHLDMQSNFLSGPLPNTIPPTLSFLSLAHNKLSGNLTTFSRADPPPSLYILDLSFNKLTSVLPPSLLGLPQLHSLLLQHNHLWGLVNPPSLVSMETLDLSFNDLSGPISPFLSTASNLYLNNNRFMGHVPQEFVDQLLSGDLLNLYLQHNLVTQFHLDPLIPLPPTSSLCVDFNCMETPPQSHCPDRVAVGVSRPDNQCGH